LNQTFTYCITGDGKQIYCSTIGNVKVFNIDGGGSVVAMLQRLEKEVDPYFPSY
jgi:hypothetical protein